MKHSLLVVLILLFTQHCAVADDSPHTVTVQRDIKFATVDGVDLLLDLHMPDGIENPPLVMFIHGGGWKNGDRKRCRLAWVAKHGYAVASIEYRLSHEAIFPAQIHDCKGALRWLRARQDEYGYDAGRVVVAGTSAGGHLAALMGTTGGVDALEGDSVGYTDQSSRVQGIIDYYGPTDFLLRSKQHAKKTDDPSGSVYQLMGGPVKEKRDLAALASPALHVTKDDPPLLILHGENDKTVFLPQSQRLSEVYEQHNLPVTLHVEPKAGHGWSPTSDAEKQHVIQFLNQRLARP